jgi:diguanylate cyclase (GGDEF)-like protein/PAS domain S-box-containing protein
MITPIRVLIIEDSPEDAELLVRELIRGGFEPEYERVDSADAMSAALAVKPWDLVITDCALPQFSGKAALELLHHRGLELPFIIVSGTIGEDAAVSMMKAGAHDYFVKGNLKRLVHSVERELRKTRIRLEAKHAQERLSRSEERFRQMAEHIEEVFWMTNPDKNEILYVSPGYEKIWGRACDEVYRRPSLWIEAIHPDDQERMMAALPKQGAGKYEEEFRIVRPDGSVRWIRDRAFPIKDASGRVYRLTGIAEDITDRKLNENHLRNAKDFSDNLIQTANVIILGLDLDGAITIFNEAAEKITGYTWADLKDKNWFEVLTPRDRYPQVWDEFLRFKATGAASAFENPILTKSGQERLIEWQNNLVRVDGKIIATISFGNDVTDRRRAIDALQTSEERLRMAIGAARMYTWDWDIGTDRLVRSGDLEVHGVIAQNSTSSYHSFIKTIHCDDRESFERDVEIALRTCALSRFEYRIVRPESGVHWLQTQGQAYRDSNGRAVRMVGVTQDITERKRAEDLVQQMAFFDQLTGLPNRNKFYERIGQTIQNGGEGSSGALLLLDLNQFREINDTLGHHQGDVVLKEVARRLRDVIVEPDVVARLGGDEFAILLPNLHDALDLSAVVQKIHVTLNAPITIASLPIAVEAGIGIALYPDHGADPDTLVQRADVAMYASKASGASYVVYEAKRDQHSTARLARMAELRLAIEQDELLLHYQPTINLRNATISGTEALVRWVHPKRGLIPPDDFIGAAEKTGVIHPLTDWVIQSAMRQCAAWRKAGHKLSVAVNLSARNLLDPQLPAKLSASLRNHGVKSDWFAVELTETAIMVDTNRATEVLMHLHELGIKISIDDFGAGYSSLSYLRRLPVDRLKIDRSFVMNMTQNPSDAMIVRSIIELGHNLGLEVVAEGVELEEQYDQLQSWGCDVAQGYFMSRPLPAADLAKWLKTSVWGMGRRAPSPRRFVAS